MTGLSGIGRALLGMGLVLVVVGALLLLADKLPWLRLGRLPGDLAVERPHLRLYFPLATSILISIVVSLALWLVSRLR